MFRLVVAFALVGSASAQPISEGAPVLDAGRIGIEVGLLLTEVAVDDGVSVATLGPDIEARLGVGRGVAVIVGVPVVVASGQVDVLDPVVALKQEIAAPPGWALGVLAETTLPVGSEGGGVVTPSLFVLAERNAGPATLGTQVGATWDRAGDRIEGTATAVLLTPLAGPLSGFVEVVAETSPAGLAVLGHAGGSLALGARATVELHGGIALTDAAPGPYVGAGATVEL